MPPQVHTVMQDAADLDDPTATHAVEQQMAPSAAVSCDMKCANAVHDLISSPGSRNIGTIH